MNDYCCVIEEHAINACRVLPELTIGPGHEHYGQSEEDVHR